MIRSRFERLYRDIAEGELAQALAAAGVLAAANTTLRLPREQLSRHLTWKFQHRWVIAPWIMPSLAEFRRVDPRDLAQAWRTSIEAHQSEPRLEVRAGKRRNISLFDEWLLSRLAHPAVGAGSVYVLDEHPRAQALFNWPLRVDFLGDAAMQAAAGASIFHGEYLSELVIRGSLSTQPDLLVSAGDLRFTLSALLAGPSSRRADCIVVLGSPGAPPERIQGLIQKLGEEVATAGIAVLGLPEEFLAGALHAIIDELAHDHPLDVALFEVARRHAATPLLLAARALTEGARLSGLVRRLGTEMAALGEEVLTIPPEAAQSSPLPQLRGTARELGRALARRAERLDYSREINAAQDVVRIRHAMAPHLGDPKQPPAPCPPPPTPRHLQAELADKRGERVVRALEPGRPYSLSVTIAPIQTKRAGLAVAEPALDESQLDIGPEGIELTVVFAEAPRDKRPRKAQIGKLCLPPIGAPRRPCIFMVRPGNGANLFEGRITVLYRNRVLQTARLLAQVATGSQRGPLDLSLAILELEKAADAAGRQGFDAALVLNDTNSGPTVTGIAGEEAVVTQIGNVKGLAETVSAAISLFTERDRGTGPLPREEMLELFRAVALPGSQVWAYLERKLPDKLRTAERVQVVEAAVGAMLPVELLYRVPAPDPGAKLCPGGPPVPGRPCSACPDTEHASSVACMNQFWGLRTVVERVGLRDDVPAGAVARLAVGRDDNLSLSLESAAYGTCTAVDEAMPPGTPSEHLPTMQARRSIEMLVGAEHVRDLQWLDDWREAVRETSPGLIALLVHKTKDTVNEALQLRDSRPVPVANIREWHLVGPKGVHPLVVVMGCKTALSKTEVLSLAPWLMLQKAGAVVCTLSPVLGRYAGPALATILDTIGQHRGRGTLGDALLAAKRSLIQAGEPIGMTLVSYGDVNLKL